MVVNSFFTIQKEHLAALSDEGAIKCIQELLWAEATSIGITKSLINVPNNIRAADGGVDAEVSCPIVNQGQGVIKSGLTCYQIKSGRSFDPADKTGIQQILFKNGSKTKLKPRVKSCLDKNGTLVIVTFGWDNPDRTDNGLINRYKEVLEKVDAKYKNAKIEVWPQNKLEGFFNSYPSLVLKITGRDPGKHQTHHSWGQNADMKTVFETGEEQKKHIASIRKELIENSDAIHIRIFGEAGIGKTRLAYETLDHENLAPLVIYFENVESFHMSELLNDILKDDNGYSVVMVIDECDEAQSAKIWNKLKHRNSRVRLITISHDYDKEPSTKLIYQVSSLSADQIKKIIQTYTPGMDYLNEWSELCSGSPRVAHIIGNNLKNNPDYLLKEPDTGKLWSWYITGKDFPESQEVKDRHLILRYLSLFKKFGVQRPFQDEFKAIVELIKEVNPNLMERRVNEHISVLQKRKILQGSTTLYITPKALHIKLWLEWWETYGQNFDFEKFLEKIPDSLHEHFKEMFKYASATIPASKVVQKLLGPDGPFNNADFLKKKADTEFFLILAEAEPELGLERLERTIGKLSTDELKKLREGRRQIVWALEKIVMWRPLFHRAANLLLSLAKAENEDYSNNATGIFVDLFSPAYGRLAPSEASPNERFPLLEKIISSQDTIERALAIKAIDRALEINHFSGSVGHDFQGLGRIPQLWKPATYQEWYDHYRRIWDLMNRSLETLPEENRKEAIEVILNRAQTLCRHPNIASMILDTIESLSKKDFIDKRFILTAAIHVLKYADDEISDDIRARWSNLQNSLVGTDFYSRMRRYVGMALIEDQDIGENGKIINSSEKEIEKLASEALINRGALSQELPWLVTSDAPNGFLFGYNLGLQDKKQTLVNQLIEKLKEAGEKSNVYFLGGYFKALFELNSNKWEHYIEQISLDDSLIKHLVELIWRSGFTQKISSLIIEKTKHGAILGKDLKIFTWGSAVKKFDESALIDLVNFLLSRTEFDSVFTAVELFTVYYLRGKKEEKVPVRPTLKILTHPVLAKEIKIKNRQDFQLLAYNWSRIALRFIDQHPSYRGKLTEFLLNNLGNDNSFLDSYDDEINQVLNLLIKEDPVSAWNIISKYLGPPLNSKSYRLSRLLQKAAIFHIPLNLIFKWIDGNISERAWYLASFIPKTLNNIPSSPARELLIKYGQREDVRNNLRSNYFTDIFMGSESEHYEEKLKSILQYKEVETHASVLLWIDEYIAYLKAVIERAKIREEREGF